MNQLHHGLFSKTLDIGLSCIPIYAKSGAAFFDDWQQYSKRLPTEEESERWDNSYSDDKIYGIALVLGPASGLVCSDIDVIEKEVHDIVPKSPYGKRGLPGRASYFYKYDSLLSNINEKNTGVGLRVINQYTIIPPSLHRKFDGRYEWLGKSLFDLDRDEVPELSDMSWMKELNLIENIESTEGRNDHLKRMTVAMRHDGKSDNEIVKFIYDYDFRNHSPRLFTDPKEQFKAKNEDEAIRAAHKMVSSITSSLLRTNADIKLPFQKKEIEIVTDIDRFMPRPYPVPSSGFLRTFVDAANASSRFDVTPLALGGALSLLSVLCANRVKLNNTWPNIYVLGLAQSGTGKGIIPDLIKELLSGTGLIGADMYKSSQAFIEKLSSQPQRLDVMDEASPFFDSMKSTASYTSDLADIVNKLFSVSKSRFDGVSTVKHGGKSGSCWNPCVSIYASTHHEGFLRSVQGYLGQSGLMPRFLVFDLPKPSDIKAKIIERSLSGELSVCLKRFVQLHGSVYDYRYHNDFVVDATPGEPQNRRPDPRAMIIDDGAYELLEHYELKSAESAMSQYDSKDAPYIARKGEYATKIALLSAVSNCHDDVLKEDVNYAIELIETCFYNAQLIRSRIVNSGRVSGPESRIFNALKKHGPMSRAVLRRTVDIPINELDSILRPLIDEGEIDCSVVSTATKPKQIYTLLAHQAKQ